MVKHVEVELSEGVNEINSVVLYAPSRKDLKLCSSIKQSFMRTALKISSNHTPAENEKSNTDEMDGHAMLMFLQGSDVETSNLVEQFIESCTDSKLCQANGSTIQRDFWDSCNLEDIERIFEAFLENFIII